MSANTLFLRLEGPFQAWGDQQSKFVVRRTAGMPTKSGVIGLLLCALGVGREDAQAPLGEAAVPFQGEAWLRPYGSILEALSQLELGVRADRPGVRWWDYHTVGAGIGVRKADGGMREQPLLTRREYLCDASFLVALRAGAAFNGGGPELIAMLHEKLHAPHWPPYLGRKCCPPGRPLLEAGADATDTQYQLGECADLREALCHIPWQARHPDERTPQKQRWPDSLDCALEWRGDGAEEAPASALVHYDVPLSLAPPAHGPRYVLPDTLTVSDTGEVKLRRDADRGWLKPLMRRVLAPPRVRADYRNTEYRRQRFERLYADENLCVFCKQPATTVQHVTYRRAQREEQDDLRALCRLCHDAITMLEYGAGMGLDRIDPADPTWRERILAKREEIIAFRSLETQRRRLSPEDQRALEEEGE